MDVFFTHNSVTDVPLYNCSAVTDKRLSEMSITRRPIQGICAFFVGFCMLFVYIACLRAMIKLSLTRKACYKIMFVIGFYEIATVLINDFFFAYSLTFGLEFCEAPNTFYVVGCLMSMCWSGGSYLCLYLAFNRIIEALEFRREIIEFLFSPARTTFGVLIGIIYSMQFLFFVTPPVFSCDVATTIPNPAGVEILPSFELRYGLFITNNLGVVVITCVLYGIFFTIFRKKFKRLGLQGSQNRLKYQVFIQSTVMCSFNCFIAVSYALYLFFDEYIILPKVAFILYQFSSGLQALLYLLCNDTILKGVKNDVYGILRIEREITTADMRTMKSSGTSGVKPSTVHAIDSVSIASDVGSV